MKKSVKKFAAAALVGAALFSATGASAADRHGYDRNDRGYDNHRGYDRGYNGHRGSNHKVVHVEKRHKVKHVYKHYDSRPRYIQRDNYHYYQPQQPGRLIIGFNF